MKLRIARYIGRCHVLGPGARGALWVQGCPFNCGGCVTPEHRDFNGGREQTVAQVAEFFLQQSGIEGVTYSGGEPFAQADALAELTDILRARRPDWTFMSYTGYTYEQIIQAGNDGQKNFLGRLDLLIDGLYNKDKHANLLWRGSANQRVIFLTSRYDSWKSRVNESEINLEFAIDDRGVFCMGIPPEGFIDTMDSLVREIEGRQPKSGRSA